MSDIPYIKIARQPIKREPPRIAQAKSPDLRRVVSVVDEGVVSWNGIRRNAALHVNAEHLSQERCSFLSVGLRIADSIRRIVAPVTHAYVEITIRPECKLSSVVVRKRLGNDFQ